MIAHEFGHLILRHTQENHNKNDLFRALVFPFSPITMVSSALASVVYWLPIPTSPLGFIVGMFGFPILATIGYGQWRLRLSEFEADYAGMCLMASAGFELEGASTMLQKLEDRMQQHMANMDPNTAAQTATTLGSFLPQFLSTHPAVS